MFVYMEGGIRAVLNLKVSSSIFCGHGCMSVFLIGFASTIVDLPLPPAISGRDRELQEYVNDPVSKPKPKAVAICGAGGIGKTGLALAV